MDSILDINSSSMKQLLGKTLRSARERAELSRKGLAEIMVHHEKRPIETGKRRQDKTNEERVAQMENRLKQWEDGNNAVSIEWLPVICDVLGCDFGYLFGEYEEHNRIHADIAAETGLSEAAIQKVKMLHANYPEYTAILSALITNGNFEYLLYLLKKRFQYAPKSDDIKPIIEKVGKETHIRNAHQYMEFQRTQEIAIDLDEGRIHANKRNLLDSLITSAVSSMVPVMASEYNKPGTD